MSQQIRQQAIQIYQQALANSTIQHAVAAAVSCNATNLTIGRHQIPLAPFRSVYLIAIGKGATPLFEGVRKQLPANLPISGVISAPTPPTQLTPQTKYFHGGHPEPNQASLQAAQAALDLLATADKSTLVLFLITGGASAMFDLPLTPQIPLEDMVTLNRLLVASGAPIAEINTVRKHFSAVKGGRLALAAANVGAQLTVLISDVPAHQLDAIASGPTLADTSTVAQCEEILDRYHLRSRLPESLQQQLSSGLPETPKQIASIYAPVVLLDNDFLLQRARECAQQLGYEVVIDSTCDDWESSAAAKHLLHRIASLPRSTRPLCLLSGGEVTVALPPTPGTGGRNQHFALQCALQLQQSNEEITVLSAGSDGIDGNSTAAGAVADNTTIARAKTIGIEAQTSLNAFDSFTLFHAIGDNITTGPTANNLRDLRILLRC